MALNVQNGGERVFENYLSFLTEIRTAIINEMSPDDRCRFTRASKLCSKEAKRSKFFIHSLEIKFVAGTSAEFVVLYNRNDREMGYKMKFGNTNEQSYQKLYQDEVLWTKQLASHGDICQSAIEFFKQSLQCSQNTFNTLTLDGTENYDFGFESFSNLKTLFAFSHLEFQRVTSKMRRPLKKLFNYEAPNNMLPDDCEKLYQIQDFFHSGGLRLNYNQFLNFSAKSMMINIGTITPNNLSDFIKSWQDGTIRTTFGSCEWSFTDLHFDIQQFLGLLHLAYDDSERAEFTIKHNKEVGKCAKLLCHHFHNSGRINFYTRIRN